MPVTPSVLEPVRLLHVATAHPWTSDRVNHREVSALQVGLIDVLEDDLADKRTRQSDGFLIAVICGELLLPLAESSLFPWLGHEPALLICQLLLGVLLIRAAVASVRFMSGRVLIVPVCLLLALVGHGLVADGETQEIVWSTIRKFVTGGAILFFAVSLLHRRDRLWEWFNRLAAPAVILNAINATTGAYEELFEEEGYLMGLSYSMLPFACATVDRLVVRPRFVHGLVALLGLAGIIGFGTRAPLFALLIFSGVRVFNRVRPHVGTFVGLVILGAVTVAPVWLLQSGRAVIAIGDALTRYGLSSRILERLAQDDLGGTSGRDLMYSNALDLLRTHPFGLGLVNDRVLIAESLGVYADSASGLYPHNLLLELCLQFGIGLGLIAIAGLIVVGVRSLKFSRQSEGHQLWLWFACGVLPLMVSASYLQFEFFWMWLALALAGSTRRRQAPTSRGDPEDPDPDG